MSRHPTVMEPLRRLLEAMALGLPAVVTDVPANLEWVNDGQNGFIARRGCPASVKEALIKLLEDAELRQVFGDRNLRIAKERADWDKNFDQFMRMFEFLLKRRDESGKFNAVDRTLVQNERVHGSN